MNASRSLVPARLGPLLWTLGLVGLVVRIVLAARMPGMELLPVWSAVQDFLHHVPPYRTRPGVLPFVYPPSALLLLSPIGLLGFASMKVAFAVFNAFVIAASGALSLALFGVPWRSPAGGAVLVGLCFFSPVVQNLNSGNVNGLVLLPSVAALLAASRHRWVVAGALLGLAFAIKPVVLPLLIIFVLWRHWRAALVALAIPLALSAVALAFAVGGEHYFRHGGLLLPTPRSAPPPTSIALVRALYFLGLPAQVATVLRVVVMGIAVATVWRCWRSEGDERLKLVEIGSLALIATFLAHFFAWPHYGLFLLPLLVSIVHEASPMRSWITPVAYYCMGAPDVRVWFWAAPPDFLLLRFTLGFVLLFVELMIAAWRPGRARPPASALSRSALR